MYRITGSFVLCILICSVNLVVEIDAYNELHQCKGIRTKRHAQISMPPNIGGSWFSPRCELLPGPQYLLRQYEFSSSNNKFVITRYYYSDEFCGEVSYAIKASGTLTPQSKSWYLNEATDMDILLTDVVVKPYTATMSMVLKSQVFKADCAYEDDGDVWNSPPFPGVRVNSSSVECLQSLSFSVNELLVMRQVDYYSKNTASASSRSPRLTPKAERELQLGDGVWFSLVDRPSSYQPPLYSVTHRHCEACNCIYRASIESPPVRCHSNRHILVPYNISGHWFSQTCESVPYSLFTLRSYIFNEENSTFNITTHYYTDTFCTEQSFVLRAEGRLVSGETHSRIYNTRSYQLIFEKVYVGVLSEVFHKVVQLGDPSHCGLVTSWVMGEMYDVMSTGGCSALGFTVRNSEHILIKVEQHHSDSQFILLSEMKTDPKRFEDQVTHFTPKLKRCDSEPLRWVKRNIIGPSTIPNPTADSASLYSSTRTVYLGVVFTMLLIT